MRVEGALVYAINPGEHLGHPRSVIEGAIAGIPLVVPDEPTMRLLGGDCAHFCDRGNADSLAAALAAALDSPQPANDSPSPSGSVPSTPRRWSSRRGPGR